MIQSKERLRSGMEGGRSTETGTLSPVRLVMVGRLVLLLLPVVASMGLILLADNLATSATPPKLTKTRVADTINEPTNHSHQSQQSTHLILLQCPPSLSTLYFPLRKKKKKKDVSRTLE
jgi:hypothetical protein